MEKQNESLFTPTGEYFSDGIKYPHKQLSEEDKEIIFQRRAENAKIQTIESYWDDDPFNN
ncbi:MAG: hypothetical protein LBE91_18985 [Tannerella sp.]|jgi:hypothetical protein|nr:hypothetical protein [Tannerella sp.]